MRYLSIMNNKTVRPLLGAVLLTMTGWVHAQINTPGQGPGMQRPSDSMQPPVIPGKPFEKGTTRGEEAERKNRFDKNQQESLSEAEYREHRKEGVYDYGTEKPPRPEQAARGQAIDELHIESSSTFASSPTGAFSFSL